LSARIDPEEAKEPKIRLRPVPRPVNIKIGGTLTSEAAYRYRTYMPSSYLIFDFGGDEQNAQQARHKLESWKQGFRLGDKLAIKFERDQTEPDEDEKAEEIEGASKEPAGEGRRGGKKKSPTKGRKSKESGDDQSDASGNVRLIVRLNFSDHEKLSLQRWLDRIPTEEPFKAVDAKIVRHNDPDFATTNQLFEELA
jgi:hypothetical protein